jgi:hypothetical protein
MRFRRPSRKWVIIAVVALALVGAGLYAWQSVQAWSAYERRLNAEKAEYEELKKQATTGSAQERLRAIRELDDKLPDRATLCDMNGLYAWQASIVPALRDGVKACESAVKRLDALASPLGALRDYLDTADKLQGAIADMAPTEPLTEKNWAELGLKRAEQARDSIKDLGAQDQDAKQLLEQARVLSDQLVKAWQTLVSANDAKNKDAFIGASAAVAKAYADFASLADTADTDIAEKADTALKAASATSRS